MHVTIIEDNPETLGVLRDFVRTVEPQATIETLVNGNSLLESELKLNTDVLILGFDLGHSVTGAELLSYLEWSGRISSRTHVVFVSNTVDEARRQAPLRFTLTRFFAKPISLAHVSDILRVAEQNRDYFSSVFYLIDKQKWTAALNSLELCKEGCPDHLLEQAWLLECMLLTTLRRFSRVLRRYALIQGYDWSSFMRIRSLAALGQAKKCRQVFKSCAHNEPYFSGSLAIVNQLNLALKDGEDGFLPNNLKGSEMSLFECEYQAALLTHKGKWLQAVSYLSNKQQRTEKRSHQYYFFAVATVKILFYQSLRDPSPDMLAHIEKQLTTFMHQLEQRPGERDAELVESLLPAYAQGLEKGQITSENETSLVLGEATADRSPFSLMVRCLNDWRNSGQLPVYSVFQCIQLIEKQGATSRASTNLLLLQCLVDLILPHPRQQLLLNNHVGKLLFKAGCADLAAYAFASGLKIHPENPKLNDRLQTCMRKLDVAEFSSYRFPTSA
ncbi:response regulator [Aliidiomarina sp. Khilg15.8]